MNTDNPILKQFKPIECGIKRRLIAKDYKVGETFIVKDDGNHHDNNAIDQKRVVFQP